MDMLGRVFVVSFAGFVFAANLTAAGFSRPLLFEANRGQAAGDVAFIARSAKHQISFSKTRAAFTAVDGHSAVHFRFVDSARTAAHGDGLTASRSSFFLGNDPSKWRRNIENYASVRYTNVYPGIDAVFYAKGSQLEYDL